jgi:hypothetical protein
LAQFVALPLAYRAKKLAQSSAVLEIIRHERKIYLGLLLPPMVINQMLPHIKSKVPRVRSLKCTLDKSHIGEKSDGFRDFLGGGKLTGGIKFSESTNTEMCEVNDNPDQRNLP